EDDVAPGHADIFYDCAVRGGEADGQTKRETQGIFGRPLNLQDRESIQGIRDRLHARQPHGMSPVWVSICGVTGARPDHFLKNQNVTHLWLAGNSLGLDTLWFISRSCRLCVWRGRSRWLVAGPPVLQAGARGSFRQATLEIAPGVKLHPVLSAPERYGCVIKRLECLVSSGSKTHKSCFRQDGVLGRVSALRGGYEIAVFQG